MTTSRQILNRRRFLGTLAASVGSCALPGQPACGSANPRRRKIILSFYCDDTSPYTAGSGAFRTFLDFCAEHHVAGESSCILGMNGRSMAREPNEEQQAFLSQVKRACDCGIDTQMELMTHHGLFDFKENREPEGAVHEGASLFAIWRRNRRIAFGIPTGKGSIPRRAWAGGPSGRSWKEFTSISATASPGCGPATSPIGTNKVAAGVSSGVSDL